MIPNLARIVFSLTLPLVLWLAFGQPSIAMAGNAGLFGLALVLLFGMLWHDSVARAFNSDQFTYGIVSLALNAVFGVLGLVVVGWLFYVAPTGFASMGDVPGLAWAALLVLLLMSWLVPMMTNNKVSELPRKSSRREFANPTKN
ncbi:MAG: hypothetical protein HY017_27580 [Betaproteobacteria bacterium]|nr:hypothetical protein [Betaproteobacteria bacterium]